MNNQAFRDFSDFVAVIDAATTCTDGRTVRFDVALAQLTILSAVQRTAEQNLRQVPLRTVFYSRHSRRFLNTKPKRRRAKWNKAISSAYTKAMRPLLPEDLKDIWNNARPRL